MTTEMVSPDNVSIRRLINNDSEYHVSIPKKWVSGLGLSGYLKLTKNTDSISIERLSL
jgi:hypothetical protein